MKLNKLAGMVLAILVGLPATGALAVTYIGDAASFGTAVPAGVGSNNLRADTIAVLSYINSNEVAGTFYTAPAAQMIQLVEVNYAAQNSGSLVPFVALYNGGATNNANNYTLLAKGDTLASPGTGNTLGTLANQAFTVGGNNPILSLNPGDTIVAGWFQNSQIVVFQNVNGGGTNDRIWNNPGNIVGAIAPGNAFTAGNANFNFNLPYRFNIGFNVVAAVPEPATATLGLLGMAGLTLRRRRMA